MTDCTFPKRQERPEILCELSSHVTEATEIGLKLLLGLMVNLAVLECWVMKSAALWAVVGLLTQLAFVNWLYNWHLGFWNSLIKLWHKCGSGTRAALECRFLGLTVPFLCPNLYPT